MKKTIIIVILILVINICAIILFKYINIKNNDRIATHIFSHRGASGEEIEHTIAAYDLAIAYGSKYIEQDIVVSKNGTLYISHDLSAKRITGTDKNYNDMYDDEIDTLKTKDNQKILSLKEVFDRYKKDDVNFVIEIKDASAVEILIKMIEYYNFEKRVIVQCFNENVLKRIKEALPKITTLYLVNTQENFDNGINFSYIDIISVEKTLMKKNNCDLAHKSGKMFNVFTINSENEIKEAIKIDVDSYFTDYTAKAMVIEKKYRR